MKVRKLKTCTKIELQGELTIYQAQEVNAVLRENVADSRSLEINLQNVTEVDTAGIQLLLAAKRESERLGKKMSMVSHSNAVVEVLDLLNISHEFGDPIVLSSDQS